MEATRVQLDSQSQVSTDRWTTLTIVVTELKKTTLTEMSNCRKILSSVTKQVLLLQSQLNDQSEEWFGNLEHESTTLRSMRSSYSEGLQTITGSVEAFEEFVQRLSIAVDDITREHQLHVSTMSQSQSNHFAASESHYIQLAEEQYSKLKHTCDEFCVSMTSQWNTSSQSYDSKFNELEEHLKFSDTSLKQRIVGMEQRSIRQEAQLREKAMEIEEKWIEQQK
jgi:hypothetical protein